MSTRRLVRIFAALLFGAMLRSLAAPPPTSPPLTATSVPACRTEDGEWVADVLQRYASEWEDARWLASTAAPGALSEPVSQLRRIRGDLREEVLPECAIEAKVLLLGSMDATIDGFVGLSANRADYRSDFDRASTLMTAYVRELPSITWLPRPTATPARLG